MHDAYPFFMYRARGVDIYPGGRSYELALVPARAAPAAEGAAWCWEIWGEHRFPSAWLHGIASFNPVYLDDLVKICYLTGCH